MDAHRVPQAARARPRLNIYTKALRRERIFSRRRLGSSYAAIASKEGLSEQHVRQIVADALKRQGVDSERDHALLQFVRLEGATRLRPNRSPRATSRRFRPISRFSSGSTAIRRRARRSPSTTRPHGKNCSPRSTASPPDCRPARPANRRGEPPPRLRLQRLIKRIPIRR
jgi:hypothetical protein